MQNNADVFLPFPWPECYFLITARRYEKAVINACCHGKILLGTTCRYTEMHILQVPSVGHRRHIAIGTI